MDFQDGLIYGRVWRTSFFREGTRRGAKNVLCLLSESGFAGFGWIFGMVGGWSMHEHEVRLSSAKRGSARRGVAQDAQ